MKIFKYERSKMKASPNILLLLLFWMSSREKERAKKIIIINNCKMFPTLSKLYCNS